MRSDTLGDWTDQLQPAVLAANTMLKLSTGFTPFYLMFGRKCDIDNLLKLAKYRDVTGAKIPETLTQPSDSSKLTITIEEKSGTQQDTTTEDPFSFVSDPDEWIQDQINERKENLLLAKTHIQKEQTRQKIIYDKKVKSNR